MNSDGDGFGIPQPTHSTKATEENSSKPLRDRVSCRFLDGLEQCDHKSSSRTKSCHSFAYLSGAVRNTILHRIMRPITGRAKERYSICSTHSFARVEKYLTLCHLPEWHFREEVEGHGFRH